MSTVGERSTVAQHRAGTGGSVWLLRLEHGPVNALDLELCVELTDRLAKLSTTGRPIVVTGRGKAFSAGVDLRRLLDGGRAYVREFVPALDALFRTALAVPVPVVAAVNGHAIAGGAVLAAAADAVVMAEGPGRIGVPELRVGVAFPRAALAVLHHRLGEVSARRLILDAGTHSATEAQSLGLVDQTTAAGDVVDRAVAAAEHLSTLAPPDAFAMTKDQLGQDSAALLAPDPDADAAIVELWCRRIEDGWLERYLEQATRR